MGSPPVSIREFLASRRIAVAGVSRDPRQAANAIYRKLRAAGYEVFAVNPHAAQVEGDPCYSNLGAIPGGVDAVVVATRPEVSEQIVRECLQLGVTRVWMHRSFGHGSVSPRAVESCRERGVGVIAAGCPLMYVEPVDVAHKCIRWILGWTGRLPAAR